MGGGLHVHVQVFFVAYIINASEYECYNIYAMIIIYLISSSIFVIQSQYTIYVHLNGYQNSL